MSDIIDKYNNETSNKMTEFTENIMRSWMLNLFVELSRIIKDFGIENAPSSSPNLLGVFYYLKNANKKEKQLFYDIAIETLEHIHNIEDLDNFISILLEDVLRKTNLYSKEECRVPIDHLINYMKVEEYKIVNRR